MSTGSINSSPFIINPFENQLKENLWLKNRFSLNQLDSLPPEVHAALCKPEIQCFFDKDGNQKYISSMYDFSIHATKALENDWVRNQIGKWLTFQQLKDITKEGSLLLCNPQIQCFLDHQENQQFIGPISGFSEDAARAFENDWVRNQIGKGLALQQLIDINEEVSHLLCNPKIQCFLDQGENQQFIGPVCSFSWQAAEAFDNDWVRNQIGKGLTFQQLIDITSDASDAFWSPEVQNFLELEENQQYIGPFSCFSCERTFALKDEWVRNQIGKGLTFQQLIDATDHGSEILIKPKIQRFLELEENQQYISQVSCFSYEVAQAFENDWVRDQIGKQLTFQELANIPFLWTTNVLCNSKIQVWLEKDENLKYIRTIINLSFRALETLNNDWVITQITLNLLSIEALENITTRQAYNLVNPNIQREIDQDPVNWNKVFNEDV